MGILIPLVVGLGNEMSKGNGDRFAFILILGYVDIKG